MQISYFWIKARVIISPSIALTVQSTRQACQNQSVKSTGQWLECPLFIQAKMVLKRPEMQPCFPFRPRPWHRGDTILISYLRAKSIS